MGTAYKIRCNRCGASFPLGSSPSCFFSARNGAPDHIETEIPMRCPACYHRLNPSREEFRAQQQAAATEPR